MKTFRNVTSCLLLLIMSQSALGQRVIRQDDASGALDARWRTAMAAAANSDESFAVGFSFERMMSEAYYFQRSNRWEMHSDGYNDSNGPSLLQMTSGLIPESESVSTAEAVRRTARMVLVELGRLERDETLVPRDVGFVMTFHRGRAVNVWLGNVELNPRIDAPTLYWVGAGEARGAFDLLEGLYTRSTGDNHNVAEGVVAALGAVNDKDRVIPFLSGVLQSGVHEDVRDEAANWLGRQYDARALPVLIRAANEDASRDVQEEAVEAIGELRVPGSFGALVQITESHADQRVREGAVEELADYRTIESARALQRIATTDKSRSVQEEAIEALADMPPDLGRPILITLLSSHPLASLRSEVAEALGEIPGEASIDALKKAVLTDQSASVRNDALEALAEMSAGSGIPAVIDVAMNHPSGSTRREAVELLSESRDQRARAAIAAMAEQ